MKSVISPVLICLMAVSAHAGTVTVTASSSAVAQGGTLDFTVTVSSSSPVQYVSLAYAGETGSDQDATAPYSFTHTFGTVGLNKTITATAVYSDNSPSDVGSTTISVVGVTLTGSWSVLRGNTASYTARSNPTGVTMTQAAWSFENGISTPQFTDSDTSDDKSIWAGRMVAAGTLRCTATLLGVSVQVSSNVSINSRSWSTPLLCAQDNEAGWGDEPTPEAMLGQNRDRQSDDDLRYFVPQSGNGDYSSGFSIASVTSGPCTGLYYISSTTLKVDRETVINRYIKPDGPALGGMTFLEANQAYFGSEFVQAVKNHEYRGTPDTPLSWEGHQGRIENEILTFNRDPRGAIESVVATSSNNVKTTANTLIWGMESDVHDYVSDEDQLEVYGPNWGNDPDSLGAGLHRRWLSTYWTAAIHGPEQF